MSFSLTPEPNQEPKKTWTSPILALSFASFMLSGCGLKDDLILPDSAQQGAVTQAAFETTPPGTSEASA